MTEPSLRTHFQSLVAESREVEAVAQLKTLIQSLPDQSKKSGIHLLLLDNPIPWERVLEQLEQAWVTLNPAQAQDYTTIIGHDNLALSNIFSSIIQINLGKAPASGPHFLTLDHPAVKSTVIGRQVELQYLEQLMAAPERSPVVIWGASGIGKTLLAELYWEKYKGEYAVLGWLNYHTSLANTIVTEIMPQYADYPDLDKVYDKKLEWTAKKYILHELQNRAGKKLVVLNNVPLSSDVAARLEWLDNIPDLQLLITANETLEGTTAYALPPLSEEEIVNLFKVLSGQEVDAEIAELLGQLGQNALLTRLIARNIPAEDLHSAKKVIQGLHAALHEESEEEQTAEQRLLISLLDFSLQDAAERWVLLQFAAMPAMEMELEYFKALVLPDWSEGDVFDAEGLQHYLEDQEAESVHADLEGMLEALVEKGWLEMVEDRYVLPEAVRTAVELHYESYAAYFVELVESLHLSYFGEEFGKVKGNALFVAHLKGVLPYLEYGEVYMTVHRLLIKTLEDLVNWYEEEKELKLLLDVVKKQEGQWSEQFWRVAIDLSECCRRIGHLEAMDNYSRVQLEVVQKIFAHHHPHLAVSQNERGLALSELGDYSQAAQLLKLALDAVMRNYGPDHPNVARSQSNLANVLRELGDYSQATQLLQLALDAALRNFGPDHPEVTNNQSNLANVLQELGDYTQAAQLLKLALDAVMRNYGPDHPNVARSRSNLANVLYDLGEYTQAAQLLQLALDSDLRNFDQDHPSVVRSQSNLATAFSHLGDYIKATQLHELALESAMRNLGPSHPKVAIHQTNLANVLRELGEYPRAAKLLQIALDAVMRNFGPDHPNVARIQSNLADVFSDLGEYPRAVQLLELALDAAIQNFGQNHPYVAAYRSSLANILRDLGDYSRAAKLLELALDAAIQNFGQNHPYVAAYRSSLANVLRELGEYPRAAKLLELALDADMRNFGPEHPNVATYQTNLATVLSELGDYTRAIQLLELALESDLRNFGPDHPTVATTQSNLALVFNKLGDYPRAAQLLQLALSSGMRNFGPDHPNVAAYQSNLANVLRELGDYAHAAQLLQLALDSKMRNFGLKHPYTAVYQFYLAKVYQHQNRLNEAQDLIQESLAALERIFSKEHPRYVKALETYTEIQDLIQAQTPKP